jgi:hypothetical protein
LAGKGKTEKRIILQMLKGILFVGSTLIAAFYLWYTGIAILSFLWPWDEDWEDDCDYEDAA